MAEPARMAGGLCWDSDPARAGMVFEGADSPDLALAKRLLDDVKRRGFQLRRAAPGEDGPLVGHRVSGDCVDLIHIEGFSRDCFAWRKRTSSLIVPGAGLVERQVMAALSPSSTRC